MTRGGTTFHVVEIQSGAVLSRHRDRESADEMWAPEISAGEVEVIDLTMRAESSDRSQSARSSQA